MTADPAPIHFVYVATGAAGSIYPACAVVSALSALHNNPGSRVTVVTSPATRDLFRREFAVLTRSANAALVTPEPEFLDPRFESRRLKTTLPLHIEGDFLFVDCDTLVLRGLTELRSPTAVLGAVLDRNERYPFPTVPSWSTAVAAERGWKSRPRQWFNSGVMQVRAGAAANELFARWHAHWREGMHRGDLLDQPGLNAALAATPEAVAALPDTLNAFVEIVPALAHGAGIVHHFTASGMLPPRTTLARLADRLRDGDELGDVDWARLTPWSTPPAQDWRHSRAFLRARAAASHGIDTVRSVLRRTRWPGYVAQETYAAAVAFRVRREAGALDPVCVFRDGGLGDIIATLPTVARLREVHRRPVWYFCNRAFVEMPALSGLVDRTFAIRCNDAVARHLQRRLRTFALRYRDERTDAADAERIPLYQEMGLALGFADLPAPHLAVPEPGPAVAALLPPAGQPFVCIHTGPSATVRQWPAEHWAGLVRLLGPDLLPIQVGQNSHFRHRAASVGAIPGARDARALPTLRDVFALVGRAAVFVGIDSGLLHAARALGIPTVGLFGPVDPLRRHGTRTDAALLTAASVPCLGCHHHTPRLHWDNGCPNAIACMRALAPHAVADAVRRLLPG